MITNKNTMCRFSPRPPEQPWPCQLPPFWQVRIHWLIVRFSSPIQSTSSIWDHPFDWLFTWFIFWLIDFPPSRQGLDWLIVWLVSLLTDLIDCFIDSPLSRQGGRDQRPPAQDSCQLRTTRTDEERRRRERRLACNKHLLAYHMSSFLSSHLLWRFCSKMAISIDSWQERWEIYFSNFWKWRPLFVELKRCYMTWAGQRISDKPPMDWKFQWTPPN